MEELSYILNLEGTEIAIVIGENEEGCEVESCRGTVYLVEWTDGEVTECCSHGLKDVDENTQQII